MQDRIRGTNKHLSRMQMLRIRPFRIGPRVVSIAFTRRMHAGTLTHVEPLRLTLARITAFTVALGGSIAYSSLPPSHAKMDCSLVTQIAVPAVRSTAGTASQRIR